jgi:transitional endoplasmic reticulum ATPase
LLDELAEWNVGVVATTSNVDECDDAALRQGRFARRIELRAPLAEHARAIVRVRVERLFADDAALSAADIDALLDEVVERSKGLVGAQLERLIDNAALQALHNAARLEFAPFAAALRSELPIAAADAAVRDVAPPSLGGVDELWRQLFGAVVEPLRDWPAYERLGAVRTDGVLLHGPSGCGKTVLVEAVARAAALPLVTIRGPELLRAEVGASEQLVRAAFADARAKAPCLLLLDQIDAIARSRDDEQVASSEGTSGRVLGCLLTEMDGLVQRGGVATSFIVLATTNRLDLLDRAILRPGRFDLLLPVPVPERGARESILRVHLQRLRYRDAAARDELIDWAATAVAAAAPIGCTSASLAAVARETGMNCLRRHLQGASTAEQAFVERRDVVDAARQVLQIEL